MRSKPKLPSHASVDSPGGTGWKQYSPEPMPEPRRADEKRLTTRPVDVTSSTVRASPSMTRREPAGSVRSAA